MKLVCVKKMASAFYPTGCPGLTINKIYQMITEYHNDGIYYEIIDDMGDLRFYESTYFKPLYEIRNEKINMILQ
jgi:hypothetical protein